MPMPNSTISRMVCRSWLTLRSNALPAAATSPVVTDMTTLMTTTGNSAAIGLRKMIRISPMIKTMVAMPTTAKASLNVSSLSTKLATSPATPAVRPLPARSGPRAVRRSRTASSRPGSSGLSASRPTVTTCTDLSGATACGPVR